VKLVDDETIQIRCIQIKNFLPSYNNKMKAKLAGTTAEEQIFLWIILKKFLNDVESL